jgi:hypothetical protein
VLLQDAPSAAAARHVPRAAVVEPAQKPVAPQIGQVPLRYPQPGDDALANVNGLQTPVAAPVVVALQ